MTDIIGMHWAEDADGIVTLTMDDPTSEANIMNEVFEKSLTRKASSTSKILHKYQIKENEQPKNQKLWLNPIP